MEQPQPEIKQFKEFLERKLNGAKVIEYKTRFLTKVGDNYGSTMLGATVHIKNSNNSVNK